jgi:FemAB-related protein (PEP-CTERM system-associated)
MSEPIRIKPLGVEDRPRWDAYVEGHPEGTFFHLSGWKPVIEAAYGHRMHYFLAEQGAAVVGVLPLGQVRHLLFGHALISVPFCVYGGVLAADDAVREALVRHATELARRLGVDHLEMRNRAPQSADWPVKDLYFTFRKELDPDPEANLGAIPRKQRAMIRKGLKAGLAGEQDDGVERLYAAYSESVRNLGTPVFPKRYFAALKREFGDACEVLSVTHRGELVASVMNFYFRDEVLPYYGGGTAAARALAANDFMYWEVMRRAVEKGVRVFDYGRSKRDTGSFSFKKHWGFEPQPLYYAYYLVKARDVPDLNPSNPRYRLFIQAWQRLPLGVSRVVGPWLAKGLG